MIDYEFQLKYYNFQITDKGHLLLAFKGLLIFTSKPNTITMIDDNVKWIDMSEKQRLHNLIYKHYVNEYEIIKIFKLNRY